MGAPRGQGVVVGPVARLCHPRQRSSFHLLAQQLLHYSGSFPSVVILQWFARSEWHQHACFVCDVIIVHSACF